LRLALTAVLVLGTGGVALTASTVRVGVEGGAEAEARRIATFGGNRCPAIEAFPLDQASRIDAELLILCNAFRVGGEPVRLELVAQPNYNRGLAETIAGRIDLPSQTVWSSELDQHTDALLRSLAIVQPGEWQVGLYTTENRADVLAVRSTEELQRLTGAAPRNWVEDWRALSTIGLKELLDVQSSDTDTVLHMIHAGRADITLQRFSTAPDLGWHPGGSPAKILPIPGMKVAIGASRHFAVSRARPDAEALVRQLDAGIVELRRRGAITRVFEAVGLFEPRVAGWRVVNHPGPGNN
jgi:hypothetical protein